MTVFAEAPARAPERKRAAGGDNEVERDGLGRPRIIVQCDVCHGTGTVPSAKVEGRLNKCQRCKGEGKRKVSYTRVTTFVDALEDKDALMAYENRMVLIGVARDTGFLKDVASMDPEDDEVKKILNRRAEAAKELAGASKKSKHGSWLHELTELVDAGDPLPDDLDPIDFLDTMGYVEATHPLFVPVHTEKLVVCDQYRAAGTPDRVYAVREGVTLTAPNGHTFSPDELLIADTKSGRVDYPALKIAMQLGLYSRSELYDKATGDRVSMGEVNQDWAVVMHMAAGRGRTDLFWVDLNLGWAAVGLAAQVREYRSRGRKALIPFESTSQR